ncbi:endonuclease III [Microdochium nivale]|nr:endonuclease III [Microdochium nivale]
MRTSRVSQEVGRIFGGSGGSAGPSMASSGTPQQELRRSSRSAALARFAYTGGGGAVATGAAETQSAASANSTTRSARQSDNSRAKAATRAAAALTPDIEDVVPDLDQMMGGASPRKRRRLATTNSAATARIIKAEVETSTAGASSSMTTPRRTAASQTRSTRRNIVKEEEEEEDLKDGTSAAAFAVKLEDADDQSALFATYDTETKPSPPIRKAKRERKPTIAAATTATTTTAKVQPPSNWEQVWDVLVRIRTTPGSAASNAAVDTMGCERLALPTASPRDQRFHTLIALMLSSQTKDTTNAVAMRRLQTELPTAPASTSASDPPPQPGLNLENIIAVDPATLNELIWAVGFHNNKTKYIKASALICRDAWGSDIPHTFEGLTSLPGVGPKMAHLCLSAAWGRTEGIGVDVHVHRIANMWGWTSSRGSKPTKTPEDTRKALESWLPRDRWRDINWLLVGLGQTVCGPVSKKCGDCEIGVNGLCRAADRSKVNAARAAAAAAAGLKKEEGKKEEEEEEKKEMVGVGVKEEGGSGRRIKRNETEQVHGDDGLVYIKDEEGVSLALPPVEAAAGTKAEEVGIVKSEPDEARHGVHEDVKPAVAATFPRETKIKVEQ